MTFGGFSQEGLAFLTGMGSKDKVFLDANRKTYESEVAEPAKAFVEAMGEALADTISPEITAIPKTNGSISPINNDVRFSKDASPYKDHLLFRFWEGPDKKAAPTLFVRVSEESVGFASGTHIKSLDRWRELVDDETTGGWLTAAIAGVSKGRKLDIDGQGLKRVPSPYSEDHPRAELLKYKALQVRWPEPTPAIIHKPGFVDWCVKRLIVVSPVHRWLVEHQP